MLCTIVAHPVLQRYGKSKCSKHIIYLMTDVTASLVYNMHSTDMSTEHETQTSLMRTTAL